MLLTVTSFEILPKDKGYGCASDPFALNCYIFTPLIYKKMLLSF